MRRLAGEAGASSSIWTLVGFLLFAAAYLVLFYSAGYPEGRRAQNLFLVMLPDEYLGWWTGGGTSGVALLDRAPVLLLSVFIIGLGYLAGRLLMRLAKADRQLAHLELLVFATAVGLNILSLYTLAIGLLGQLHNRFLFLVPAAALPVLYLWLRHRGWFRRDADMARPLPEADGFLGRYAWCLTVPFAVAILLGAMLPPWHFDVREYHLQVPKEWFQLGRIVFLPHNVYGNMPMGAGMHALLGMEFLDGWLDWWWGALVGKTVIGGFALLTAVALYAAGCRFAGNRAAGGVAAVVYLSTPWVAQISCAGLIDGAVACYLFLAVYAALLWNREQQPARLRAPADSRSADPQAADSSSWGLLALSGFLAGAAVSCKYPSVLFVVFPLFFYVLLSRGRVNWRPAVIFLCAVALGCGLWFGKNLVLTGNPTYPLLYNTFGGKSWNAEKHRRWQRAHGAPRDSQGRAYTFSQLRFSLAEVAWRAKWLNPVLVPLAGLALLVRGNRRLLLLLSGMFLYIVCTWWLATHRIDRFWFPGLPLLALVAGMGATWTEQSSWRTVVGVLLVAGCLANLLLVTSRWSESDVRYLAALDELRNDAPREQDQEQAVPRRLSPVHNLLNHIVPDGHTVLSVGDAQVFDLEKPVLYNTCFDDCIFEQLMTGRTREQRLKALRARKISHVYIHWYEIDRYRSPGNYGYTDYVTRQLVYGELIPQGILRRIGPPSEIVEVFEVPDSQ